MKKLGRAIAVLLLLFVTPLPAAAACCVGKAMSKAAAMHAAMPCCSDTCRMTKTATSRDHEIALTSNPAPGARVAVVMVVIPADTPAATSRAAAHERVSTDLSPPPPFLLHRQFRI